jgi:hypothetical protein
MAFRPLHVIAALFAAVGAAALPSAVMAQAQGTPFTRWASANCSASSGCGVSFGTVPDNRIWLIKFVSCSTSINNPNGKIAYWFLFANNPANTKRIGLVHLRPTLVGATAQQATYNATETAYLRLPPGSPLSVAVDRDPSVAAAFPSLDCTIGGDAIPAP